MIFTDDYEHNVKEAEEQLDAIYHAIPEWIHREFPNIPLAEKVEKGFVRQQKVLTDIYLNQVKDYDKMKEFASWLVKKHDSDFMHEYWEFLVSQGKQKDEVGVLTNVKK